MLIEEGQDRRAESVIPDFLPDSQSNLPSKQITDRRSDALAHQSGSFSLFSIHSRYSLKASIIHKCKPGSVSSNCRCLFPDFLLCEESFLMPASLNVFCPRRIPSVLSASLRSAPVTPGLRRSVCRLIW
jgi:hypothetical protein